MYLHLKADNTDSVMKNLKYVIRKPYFIMANFFAESCLTILLRWILVENINEVTDR